MTKISKRIALGTAAALGFVLASAPAAAQATRTWVSGVGDDVNPCSRTAPCKTFAGAISKTAAGGEINCIDPGGFGAVTITKSISILCDQVEAGVVVAGTSAIIINSSTAIVTLSGLDLEGLGNAPTTPGIHGVNIINAAAVRVLNTKIRGFRNGNGINIAPQGGSVKVFVDNVQIGDGGTAGNVTTGGIGIYPGNAAGVQLSVRNSAVNNNLNTGLRADTTSTGGSVISVSIENSQLNGNGNGIQVKTPAGTGTFKLMVSDSSISSNAGYGIIGNGPGFTGRVGRTTITDNINGVLSQNGGTLNSYGTNQLGGNTTDGSFTAVIPQN